MRRLAVSIVIALVAACAACAGCGRGTGAPGPGSGTGTPGGGGAEVADCEAARAHVSELYRADANDQYRGPTAKDPATIDGLVADNTAMVMAECTREPARVARCAAAARSAPELERTCIAPLDDDGTEGDRFLAR